MQEQDGKHKFNISERLEELRREHEALRWEGTFRDYFELVTQNPRLAQLSHARINDMVHAAGVEKLNEGTRDEVARYNFFASELFGIEEPIARIVEYFKSAAQRLEVRKRILLLMGPVGGGKSTIVTMLKRGLEEWTRTEAGAVYAIKDCPMHEEPLHLIPHELRPEIEKHYGIYIEGDLCPQCRYALEHTYGGRHEDVRVHRILFSEKERVGIGTFAPSDPKSQDITELTGSIDLSTIGEVGVESDPRAYRFDGELNIANRGVMEFIEMLKVDEKFLYSLLTLSQEQNIKTGRFAMIYADEVILSHTNENEYISFAGNRKSEALQDRIILVRVPYNLRVSQEERIYDKLLNQSEVLRNVHIAPNTLRVAAMFAVMTRLEEPKRANVDIVKKMKLYDGEDVEGYKSKDVRELKEETVREGMDGISPALHHQPPLGRARARRRHLHQPDRRAARHQGRLRAAHRHQPRAARALPEPHLGGAQGVRRAGEDRSAARLRLFVRRDGAHHVQQLPRQRRGLLQQGADQRPDHRRGDGARRAADALHRGADRHLRERQEHLPPGDTDPHLAPTRARAGRSSTTRTSV